VVSLMLHTDWRIHCCSHPTNLTLSCMRFEILTAVNIKIVFWHVALCSSVDEYQHLRGCPKWRQQVCPKHWYLSVKLQNHNLEDCTFSPLLSCVRMLLTM
jgi:hypothetical protein